MYRLLIRALLAISVLCSPALATQTSLVTPGPPLPMTSLATFLNNAFLTIAGCSSGSSAPAPVSSAPITYQCWVDTTTNPRVMKIYDGTSWITIGNIDTSAHTYTVPLSAGGTGQVGGFVQTGTGAVARTWQDKAREAYSVKDFGATGNGLQVAVTASITSGAAALTATGATFTSADVGKMIFVPGAGAAGAVLSTTIVGFTDATHVTLSANAGTTLTAAAITLSYGTDDTSAINLAIAAANTLHIVGIRVPAGFYFTSAALTTLTTAGDVLGDGWLTSIIFTSHATANVLTQSGSGSIRFLGVDSLVVKTAGCHINITGNGVHISDIWSRRAYVGVCNTGRVNWLSHTNIELMTSRASAANSGGVLNDGGILNVSNVSVSGATLTAAAMPEYGFRGIGGAGGGEYDISMSYVFLTNVGITVATTAAYNWNGLKVNTTWLDSTLQRGILVDSTLGNANGPTDISASWIAPGYGSTTILAGVEFKGTSTGDATLVGNTIYSYNNATGVGVYANTGGTINLTMSGNKVGGIGTGFGAGVQTSNSTARVAITGGVNTGNTTGIVIGATNTYVVVVGVSLQGNGTTLSNFSSGGAGIRLGLNPGYESDETGTGKLVFSASPTFTGTVNAADINASGNITAGAASNIRWGSSTVMQSPSDGVIALLNNAGTGFTRLQLGGTTASFPAIKRNGTALNFRLADDSADAAVTSAAHTITSASATAIAVGLNGATNPSFSVDSSTGSQASGLKVTGAVTGGTVAIVATDSGSNTNVTLNAKGSGTIGIGSVSTGTVTITPALALSTSLAISHNDLNGGSTNTNTNTGGIVTYSVQGDTSYAEFGVRNSARASYGALVANDGYMYTSSTTGLTIMADNATGVIKFAAGGNSQRAQISAAGGFSIGTTSDPGVGLIYQNSASFLMRTKTSWSTGAAASLGTLTNAPAAGNPTKWIPVDDNGTTRYIPAW